MLLYKDALLLNLRVPKGSFWSWEMPSIYRSFQVVPSFPQIPSCGNSIHHKYLTHDSRYLFRCRKLPWAVDSREMPLKHLLCRHNADTKSWSVQENGPATTLNYELRRLVSFRCRQQHKVPLTNTHSNTDTVPWVQLLGAATVFSSQSLLRPSSPIRIVALILGSSCQKHPWTSATFPKKNAVGWEKLMSKIQVPGNPPYQTSFSQCHQCLCILDIPPQDQGNVTTKFIKEKKHLLESANLCLGIRVAPWASNSDIELGFLKGSNLGFPTTWIPVEGLQVSYVLSA